MMLSPCLAALVLSSWVSGQNEPILKNSSFETATQVRAGADRQAHGWKLTPPAQIPASWTPNPAYPGELAVCRVEPSKPGAHAGQQFVRITAGNRTAHLYQMGHGLQAGKWYRVSAWVRGGAVSVSFYEYFQSGKIGGQTVAQSTAANRDWRLIQGFYRPPTDGYVRSAIALCVHPRQRVDVDDVSIEPIALPEVPAGADNLTLETDAVRVTLSPQGVLRELRCKASGKDYAVADAPFPVLHLTRRGVPTPVHSLSREGDLLRARFLDADLSATLRVTARPRHLQVAIVDVQPDDVEQLSLELPVRRLASVGGAFNATYDDQFGVCLLGTTVNVYQQLAAHGSDVLGLVVRCTRKHKMVGAQFALIAAPRAGFKPAIMEAERASGLPCPMLQGEWARDSQPVRRSYLFAVDASESNIDKIIEYAKIGHFGMIIMLKSNWLANHGHFQINTTNFPDGIASLKRAVAKIHAAGMGAGVHVFGPSISPNDPYITPKPDDRLAFVPCPALAAAVDEKATTLVLAGAPNLPPKTPRSRAFPGHYVRVGDEIVRYRDIEMGATSKLIDCQRGALGTKASRHAAGDEVKGLLAMWGFFLVDPDSTLAEELTGNFARVFNECDFDMVYFDASDGVNDAYLDRWYYLNKMHMGYYRKLKKDVLYQTSNGTGSNLMWHIVPRSASADGHGDLKKYLDERLPTMLGMAANFTCRDVGWYYMFDDVRPDQIEYVCAKTIGIEGSISIETSLATMERHPRARQMIEMIGRYEECRLADHVPADVKEQLREPGKDFKLFREGSAWKLHRALYEEPRYVDVLDGKQNVWAITNERAGPCPLGVEIACGFRNVPTVDYEQPGTLTLDSFDSTDPYGWNDHNRAQRFFSGSDVTIGKVGAAREGVDVRLTISSETTRVGDRCVTLAATNNGPRGGWGAVGRKLPGPLDLSRYQAIGLWVDGDGKGETLRLQLRDAAGRAASWNVLISFKGWRLCIFRLSEAAGPDWSKIDHLLLWLQGLAGSANVQVRLDDLRALPEVHPTPLLAMPALEINGREVVLPARLKPGQALASDGPAGVRFFPGGMQPSQPVDVSSAVLMLAPGESRIVFKADTSGGYPGDVSVLLYRLEPL